MTGSESEAAASPVAAREAFRDLHGPRLHGFALLLTLEDGPLAARLAADSLAEAMPLVEQLRDPERAAAWLRARVVRAAPRYRRRRRTTQGIPEQVAWMNAGPPVVSGLSRLRHLERAALIAHVVERFERDDIATIVGRRGARLDRLLRVALDTYLETHAAHDDGAEMWPGPTIDVIRDTVRRAMQ